jgi:hypothetical protein
MLTQSAMNETGASAEKAQALAFNLCILSSLFWGICSGFWLLMGYSMRYNKAIPTTRMQKDDPMELI